MREGGGGWGRHLPTLQSLWLTFLHGLWCLRRQHRPSLRRKASCIHLPSPPPSLLPPLLPSLQALRSQIQHEVLPKAGITPSDEDGALSFLPSSIPFFLLLQKGKSRSKCHFTFCTVFLLLNQCTTLSLSLSLLPSERTIVSPTYRSPVQKVRESRVS